MCLFITFISEELFPVLKLLSLLLCQAKKARGKKHINSLVDLPLCVFSPQKVKASHKERVNIIAELYHKKFTALLDCLSAWRSFAKRMTCVRGLCWTT